MQRASPDNIVQATGRNASITTNDRNEDKTISQFFFNNRPFHFKVNSQFINNIVSALVSNYQYIFILYEKNRGKNILTEK